MTLAEIVAVVGLIATLVSGAWALLRVMGAQFKRELTVRFEAMEAARTEGRRQWDERFTRIEETYRRLERDLLELRAELPKEYVRREDHIRFETVINAKMDSLAAKLDLVMERQQRKD